MNTKLVNKSQVKSALKVKGFAGNVLAGALMRILGLNKLNNIYKDIYQYQGVEFADKLLEYLNVSCDCLPQELEYLPKEGPFIMVSNHPFGAVDGILMLSVIAKQRPDLRILTNFILSYIPNLAEYFLPVNPFTDRPGMKSSLKGLKLAKEHLANGGVLGLFPAGEVSSNGNREKIVKDIDWQLSIVKLIKGAGVPVVPVYFEGENSRLFHIMGKVNPYLRTARLPHELINKKDRTISLRIGKPLQPSELEEYLDLETLGKYLWNRTYALEPNVCGNLPDTKQQEVKREPVAPHVDSSRLSSEIESINSHKLFEVGKYECYEASADEIPYMMQEIARSREETFRAVGEGTNRSEDTDVYDSYYRHLILWDKEKKAFIGAYRLGMGDEILEKYGVEGFYTSTLFNYRQGFRPYLKRTMELGRSFVVPEYQKDPLALMLLIKGLLYVIIKNPDVRYLVGPVSISAWYPYFYRSLMVHYLGLKQAVPALEKLVVPKSPFKPDFCRVNADDLLAGKMDSMERFDRFMYRLSNGQYRMPTLLKKYIKLNCKILSFNVDPDFNYCVDGLIVLDVLDIPKQEIDALSKEFEDKEKVYRRFGLE